MARQRMGEKATKRLARKLMLPIKYILVREGTEPDGEFTVDTWPDGEFTVDTVESVSRIWNNTRIVDGKDPEIPDVCRG